METIKPIETHYNGYRFRSRLEARWAVFFDTFGLKYQYEPEGFEMSDGTYYLPDFYFPDLNAYGEVKGGAISEADKHKILQANEEGEFANRTNGIILFGPIPSQYDMKPDAVFQLIHFDRQLMWVQFTSCFIDLFDEVNGETVHRKQPKLVVYDNGFGTPFAPDVAEFVQMIEEAPSKKLRFSYWAFNSALYQARQARFEHGETPMVRR